MIPFVNEAHRDSFNQARAIETLPGNPALTVVNDMINELRAQDASRRNGYAWSDTAIVNSLRVKLNVWVIESIQGDLLPVGDRPADGTIVSGVVGDAK